jgi:hypothetical protein
MPIIKASEGGSEVAREGERERETERPFQKNRK